MVVKTMGMTVVAAFAQRGRRHVEDAVFETPDVSPRDAGAENDRESQRSGNPTNHTLHKHHTRLLALHADRG